MVQLLRLCLNKAFQYPIPEVSLLRVGVGLDLLELVPFNSRCFLFLEDTPGEGFQDVNSYSFGVGGSFDCVGEIHQGIYIS